MIRFYFVNVMMMLINPLLTTWIMINTPSRLVYNALNSGMYTLAPNLWITLDSWTRILTIESKVTDFQQINFSLWDITHTLMLSSFTVYCQWNIQFQMVLDILLSIPVHLKVQGGTGSIKASWSY